MKVNIGIEVSDAQRVVLASMLAGKLVRRLATREDVRWFVEGVVEALAETPEIDELQAVESPPPVSAIGYTPTEQRIVDRLLAEGFSAEYARGFISAGRVIAKAGATLRVQS